MKYLGPTYTIKLFVAYLKLILDYAHPLFYLVVQEMLDCLFLFLLLPGWGFDNDSVLLTTAPGGAPFCGVSFHWALKIPSRSLPTPHCFQSLRASPSLDGNSESEVAQSCPTLWNPVDCSPSCSFVHGIFRARVLEWVAISFSRGSSWPRDRTQVSCIVSKTLYRLSHQGSPWWK